MRLTKGIFYNLEYMVFVGWSNGHQTYGSICHEEYFDKHGCYLGPDENGVEPLFVTQPNLSVGSMSSNCS